MPEPEEAGPSSAARCAATMCSRWIASRYPYSNSTTRCQAASAARQVPVLLEQLGEAVERGEELTSYRQAGDRPLDDADRGRDLALVLEPRADLHERLDQVGKGAPVRGEKLPCLAQVAVLEEDVEPVLDLPDATEKLGPLAHQPGAGEHLVGADDVAAPLEAARRLQVLPDRLPDQPRLQPVPDLRVEAGGFSGVEVVARHVGGLAQQPGLPVAVERLLVAAELLEGGGGLGGHARGLVLLERLLELAIDEQALPPDPRRFLDLAREAERLGRSHRLPRMLEGACGVQRLTGGDEEVPGLAVAAARDGDGRGERGALALSRRSDRDVGV